MTVVELVALRKRFGWTQTDLAGHFDVSLRGLQDIEHGRSTLRTVYVLAMERLAIRLASGDRDLSRLPPNVAAELKAIAPAL